MQYTYEAHIINNRLLPFVYHIDRVTDSSGLPNYHTNIELLFCFEGEGEVICDAQTYRFSVGDVIVINSNLLHKVISNKLVRYYCLIVDESFCNQNGIDITGHVFDARIDDDEVRNAYAAVCSAYASKEESKTIAVRYAVLGLLLTLNRRFSKKVDETSSKNDVKNAQRIKKVVEYIHSNLNYNISLDDISEYVGISKYHLSRDFKKFTGNTIFEYLNISRCKTAAMLISGGMSVSVAANECGFENLSYFSRTFKKYMGKLPSCLV